MSSICKLFQIDTTAVAMFHFSYFREAHQGFEYRLDSQKAAYSLETFATTS